jgi:hypothetical protein
MSKFSSKLPISEKSIILIDLFDLNARSAPAQGFLVPSGVNLFKMRNGLRQIPEKGGPASAVRR